MSWGVHRVVAGMGTTPSFIMPIMATYQSEILGAIMKARSPLPTPRPFKRFANLFDSTLISQNVCFSARSPVGSTEMRASLVRSSANLSTTSKPKLKCSGRSSVKSLRVCS